MATTTTMTGNGRYHLHAYVCGVGCVRRTTMSGSVTFEWVYQNRPKDCRYAVAGEWDVACHVERYVVWDLWGVMMHLQQGGHPPGDLIEPKPLRTHDDLDAAIVATLMLYGGE